MLREEGEATEGWGIGVGEGEEANVGGGSDGAEEGVQGAGEVWEGEVVVDCDDWLEGSDVGGYMRGGKGQDVLVPTGIVGFRAPAAFVTTQRSHR